MLFYVQMRWNYQGRLSQDELWELESREGEHGVEGIRSGFVQLYKVVSQHRIIAIVKANSFEDLDRNSMFQLPLREYLEFEVVWALRDYEGFLADVNSSRSKGSDDVQDGGRSGPSNLPSTTPEMTRTVVDNWFAAMGRGDGNAALDCLDENVTWVNGPGISGLSDIVPWLGEYHGRQAVAGTFLIWSQLSKVKQFEVRKIVIDRDEALCIVHEVATIKATGLDYDIEFIQRIKVANYKIIAWKSYWDTARGIVPFRGDMRARLIKAAERNDRDEALAVLPYGADPNTFDPETGLTALMIAAARGHTELVQILLKHGASPNIVDRRAGATALHKACQAGCLDIAIMLVEHGAWIDTQVTTTGHTPLIEAIWFKSEAIVAYLLDRNARLEPTTYYGFDLDNHINYALKVSQGTGDQEALSRIRDLVQMRRARDLQASDEASLVRAARAGDKIAFNQALAAGADIESRYPIVGGFDDGHTALLVAAREGHAELVQILIAAGADVNAVEPVFGAVPLHKATYNGRADITRMLTDVVGIDLNYQGASNGYTPLHDALWHGFADCAEILINAGARANIIAFDGKLPLDLAIEKLGPHHPLVDRLRPASSAPA